MSPSSRKFHIGSILPVEKKDAELFLQIMEAVCELGLSFSIIAEGDADTQKRIIDYGEQHPRNLTVLENIDQNKKKILDTSSVLLFLQTPDKTTLKEIISKQIIPILPGDKFFHDFNAQDETGNAFTFEEKNIWTIFNAIIRASENFKFSYDWNNLKKRLEKISL